MGLTDESLVVGIDPGSSRIAWSCFGAASGELLAYDHVSCVAEPKDRPFELTELLSVQLVEVGIGVVDPVFYIEQPFGRNISGIAAVERTVGGLLYLLHPSQELLNVNTWKKATGVPPTPREPPGRRRHWQARRDAALATLEDHGPKITSKTMIKQRCLEIYPEVPEDYRPPDIYDAILIGRAGYLINCGEYKE